MIWPHVVSTLSSCCPHVVSMLSPHGLHIPIVPMLSPCCPHMVSTSLWSPHCAHVVSTLSSCCPHVVSMLSPLGLYIPVVPTLSPCGLHIPVVPMLSQCCLHIVLMCPHVVSMLSPHVWETEILFEMMSRMLLFGTEWPSVTGDLDQGSTKCVTTVRVSCGHEEMLPAGWDRYKRGQQQL